MKLLILLFASIYVTISYGQFSFPRTIYQGNSNVRDLEFADIDGDGDLDLVTVSVVSDMLGWMENVGGEYTKLRSIGEKNNQPMSLSCSDVDLDGDIDVVYTAVGNNMVALHLNQSGGIFDEEVIISTTGLYPIHVIFSDINGDTLPDILVSFLDSETISWFENLGGGSFGNENILTNTCGGSQNIVTGDIDNDGDIDVATVCSGADKVIWFENINNSGFSSEQIISAGIDSPVCVKLSDLNLNGTLDLIVSSYSTDQVYFIENNGASSFATPISFASYIDVRDFEIQLLDSDSLPDLVGFSISNGVIYRAKNLGSFNFMQIDTLDEITDTRSIELQDINSDSNLDVVVASDISGISGIKLDSTGNVLSPISIDSIYFSDTHQYADIDSDGIPDVISVSEDKNIVFFKGLTNNEFDQLQYLITGITEVYDLQIFDLEGDGDSDIAVIGGYSDSLWIYENLGGLNFSLQSQFGNLDGAINILIEDFDSDLDLDIAVSCRQMARVKIFENSSGLIQGPVDSVIITSPAKIFYDDLNLDGQKELIILNNNNGLFSYSEYIGGFDFATPQLINGIQLSNTYIDYQLIDMNNDSLKEIVYCSGNIDHIGYLRNNGGFDFDNPTLISNQIDFPTKLSVFDINNDSLNDLVVSSFHGSLLWIESIDTFQFSNTEHNIPVNNEFSNLTRFIDSEDLNGDSALDILYVSPDNRICWNENMFGSQYIARGRIFYDANQNGERDSSEIGLGFQHTTISPGALASYSNSQGDYFFALDTNLYQVAFINTLADWSLTSDSISYSVQLSSNNPSIDSLDFGFYPDTIYSDFEVDLTTSFPRCNDTINYWISYKNIGTNITNGTIKLVLDDSVAFFQSSIIPDSIIGQSIYWHFDSLFYFDQEVIDVQIRMPSFLNINDTLTSVLLLSELDTGQSPISFIDTLSHELFCAYDPNDKSVFPEGLGNMGYIQNGTEMEYLIRFQNTGNDTAINVIIRDQLDSGLDWNSFYLMGSSHTLTSITVDNGHVEFEFEGIMLPDSTVDFLGSQGYVKFKINLQNNLEPGSIVDNSAEIYFDYNPPIITNTVVNAILDCDSVKLLSLSSICEGDSMLIGSIEPMFNSFSCYVNNVHISSSRDFYWTPAAFGIHEIRYEVSNPYCVKDSITIIEVSQSPGISLENLIICLGDSLYLQGSYQTTPGVYFDTLQSISSCDSVIQTTLTVNSTYFHQLNEQICSGDSIFLQGAFQSSPGVYYDTLQAITSCDSIIETTLSVHQIDLSVVNNDPELISNSSGSYQWLNCVDYAVIQNETNQSFIAISNGDFAVQISENGCVDTSLCETIATVGLFENEVFDIKVFPNPNKGTFKVVSGFSIIENIKIYNAQGGLVLEKMGVNSMKSEIKIDVETGVYILEIEQGEQVRRKKIFIE